MILSLFSGKGGVGKTTLTANLATNLVLLGERVLAVDFDPLNQLGIHFGIGSDEVAGLSREGIAMDSVFESPLGVHFIPFGKVNQHDLRQFEIQLKADPEWLSSALKQIAEHGRYDFILVDSTSTPGVFLKQATQAADHVWLVTLAEAAAQLTLPHATRILEVHEKPFEIILNQYNDRDLSAQEVESLIQELFAQQFLKISVPRDNSIPQALAHETTLPDYEPESTGQHAIRNLAQLLIERYSTAKPEHA